MAHCTSCSHRTAASNWQRVPCTVPCTGLARGQLANCSRRGPAHHACLAPAQHWPSKTTYSRRTSVRPSAGAVDVMPMWTLDQIAGLVFGAVMVAAVFSSKFVDSYVAKAQRRQLGLCEECGGLYDPATCAQASCPRKRAP